MDKNIILQIKNISQNQHQNKYQIQFSNLYPLAPFVFSFNNPFNYYHTFISHFDKQQNNSIETQQSPPNKKTQNIQSQSKYQSFQVESVKIQQNKSLQQQKQKLKIQTFQYYDPHEAPNLTFRIEDIQVIQEKKSTSISKSSSLQKFEVKIQEFDGNCQNHAYQYICRFVVTQPDKSIAPFTFTKNKTKKRRFLSTKQYEHRAKMVQIQRIRTLRRLQVEQKIGKKLPIRNKKWFRKKKSIVFNAREYKQKLIKSKKYKPQQDRYKKIFTSEK